MAFEGAEVICAQASRASAGVPSPLQLVSSLTGFFILRQGCNSGMAVRRSTHVCAPSCLAFLQGG